MFCTNCGKQIPEKSSFCTECGYSTEQGVQLKTSPANHLDQKWWLRFAKVIYISLYIPLPFVLFVVWSENSEYCNYGYYPNYNTTCTNTLGEAFWYSLLTLVILVVILRLVKTTFLYISLAQKPQWKKEFKKFF